MRKGKREEEMREGKRGIGNRDEGGREGRNAKVWEKVLRREGGKDSGNEKERG